MKFSLQTWIIIGLAAVIVFLILTDKDPEDPDLVVYDIELKKRAEQLQQVIEDHRQKQEKILGRFEKDSLDKVAYRNEIKGLRARLSQKRIRVDSILIDRPEVKEFISMQDSIISMQAGRIDTLETTLTGLRIDVKALNRNFDLVLDAEREKTKSTQALADAYKKDARKSKRANRWTKAGAVVLGVGGFLLGSSL